MYLITLFAIIVKLVFVSGDCDVGALNASSFDVTKVSIDILRCFVYRNLPLTGYQYAFTLYYIGKILIIIPTNAQLVFIIFCLPTCFDLYRSSSGHKGMPKVIKLYIKC